MCSWGILPTSSELKWKIMVLQKPVLEKPSTTLGELENSGLLRGAGPEELNSKLWAANKGLQSFYTWTGVIKWVCRGVAIAKSRTRVSEMSSSPHFLRLCDLHDPDFARSKLSYRGRRSRRLCKILTFPLHSPLLMLLSFIVESIISCFGRTFRALHCLGGYIELLPYVNLWIQSEKLWSW